MENTKEPVIIKGQYELFKKFEELERCENKKKDDDDEYGRPIP